MIVVGNTAATVTRNQAIESELPLYLPQARVYDRYCPTGPCIASPETVTI